MKEQLRQLPWKLMHLPQIEHQISVEQVAQTAMEEYR